MWLNLHISLQVCIFSWDGWEEEVVSTVLDLGVVSSAGISISDCGGWKEGVAVDGVAVGFLEVWIWACDGWL